MVEQCKPVIVKKVAYETSRELLGEKERTDKQKKVKLFK